jgi:adenylate cyclase class 2
MGDMTADVPASRNIELKAVDLDPGGSLRVCHALEAEDIGIIRQRDTYFNVTHGNLKLREMEPGKPELIQYGREDLPEQRLSSYRVIVVEDGAALREALTSALGTWCVVEKKRHIFMWQGVRIYLDEVEGLGRFVVLEAVAPSDSDLTEEHRLVTELRAALSITNDRICSTGYAKQLLALKSRS